MSSRSTRPPGCCASTRARTTFKMNLITATTSVALCLALVVASQAAESPLTSRAAFLRAQRAAQRQQQQPAAAATNQTVSSTTTSTTTSSSTTSTSTTTSRPRSAKVEAAGQPVASNRSTRTTDIFAQGQGYNIFVTTICEIEHMRLNVKTSQPFYGRIHTLGPNKEALCPVEGTGEREYNLEISQVLKHQDRAYCGVTRAARASPQDKEMLQAVLVVRVHRHIERSDDKYFLVNCTNRCRRDDCSEPTKADLRDPAAETEETTPRPGGLEGTKECNIYMFPWAITLLWCLAILLLAMIISHCIMCSSMMCRCVRTEVEEREPSVYEDGAGGALSLSDEEEDNLYNKKNHPMRIDYDNRDIYKTSNNYEPYDLRDDQRQVNAKTRHSSANKTPRRR